MKPDSSSNAPATDTTSTNGPTNAHASESEAEFLARQSAEAKAAIARAFGEFSRDLRDGIDPRGWTKEHPWLMVAGAAVAGFTAAATLIPTKEEQALRRLAAMERVLIPKPSKAQREGAPDTGDDGGAKDFSRGRAGFLTAVGRQLLETIKPALMSALTAGITAKAATPDNATAPPPAPDPHASADPSATI